MLDIRLIRENPEMIRKNLVRRHDPDKEKLLEDVIRWDRAWRKALAEADGLKRRRNEIMKEIAAAKKGGKSTDKLRTEAAALPKKIEALDREIDELAAKVRDGLMRLPNLLDESVPVGKDDTENVEVSRWGTPRSFDYELRPHGELLEALKLADFERARKIAGAGFVYMMGDLVRLDQALLAFALGYMVKQGFTPVFPPFMMRRSAYEGVVDLGDFESVMYKVDGEDLYLIATSEHPLGAIVEGIYGALEIPYRTVNVCTGDIGTVAAKKYDIEAWSPRQKAYREVISCSNCTDYQARRLNIRAGKVGGDKFVPHTLNSTAMATSRGLVAVLENYQNADGTVTVPKALRPHMGGQEVIPSHERGSELL